MSKYTIHCIYLINKIKLFVLTDKTNFILNFDDTYCVIDIPDFNHVISKFELCTKIFLSKDHKKLCQTPVTFSSNSSKDIFDLNLFCNIQ